MSIFFENEISWADFSLADFIFQNQPPGWEEFFDSVKEEIQGISDFLEGERKKTIYPDLPDVFRMFYELPPKKVKVLIGGMDPYINGAAVGIAFMVKEGFPVNPSLQNIYKELEAEGYTVKNKKSGNLSPWVKQGVFLFNAALTVEKGDSGSHIALWVEFTKKFLQYISKFNPIFLLWGKDIQSYGAYIKAAHILTSSHPSPFSANRGFLGCGHFKKVNEILEKNGVEWSL